MEGEGPILVFTCALNLLLMSPTLGEEFFLVLLDTIREPDFIREPKNRAVASGRILIPEVSRV
jgi:hypothetical protein